MPSNCLPPVAGPPSNGTDPFAPLELATLTRAAGEVLVIADGEVDLWTAPTLQSGLARALLHPSCRTLIADLRGVRFLSARGVSVLLMTRGDSDLLDVRLALVADHSAVHRPLDITGTTDRLTLFPTVAAARAAA